MQYWPPIAVLVAAKIGDLSYVDALVAHNVNVNAKDPQVGRQRLVCLVLAFIHC